VTVDITITNGIIACGAAPRNPLW